MLEDKCYRAPSGNVYHRMVFDSVTELADRAKTLDPKFHEHYAARGDFQGDVTGDEALKLARDGWDEHADATVELAADAIQTVTTEHTVPVFLPIHDVCGSDVDMGRYMTGDPECMVDYPLTEIVKAGKVITLCASMSVSGAISAESMVRRGQGVAALALALAQVGYAVEIWQDLTAAPRGGTRGIVRVKVKDAHDVIDPARILYALAHPSMLRVLGFAALYGTIGTTFAKPLPPERDLPEGTIYLSEVSSPRDIPDLDVQLTGYLRELGILAD